MVLYTNGTNAFLYNGEKQLCQRGTLVLTSPGEPHAFGPLIESPLSTCEITFEWESPTGSLTLPFHELLSTLTGINLPVIPVPIQMSERQTALIEGIYALLLKRLKKRDHFQAFAEQKIMFDILYFLVQEFYAVMPQTQTPETNQLQLAKWEIEQRYREHITIDELASQVCLSPSYFSRAFKSRYGISPISYQLELRIRAAQMLLKTSSRGLSDIAQLIGFSDVYAFSKAFKKIVGLSPRRWANDNKNVHTVLPK
jgi:AraC-like DNA-binding protein